MKIYVFLDSLLKEIYKKMETKMETKSTNNTNQPIIVTRHEKNGTIYPSIKITTYGVGLYISYTDPCAKAVYNSVKDVVEKLITEYPDYDVFGPMNDNGTGMYLKVTANPFKEWTGTNAPLKLSLKFTTPWINEEKKEIRFKCVMSECA